MHYRWLIVCVGLLPASFLFDLYMLVRAWFIFKLNSAPKQHDARVKEVQRQVGLSIMRSSLSFIIEIIFCCRITMCGAFRLHDTAVMLATASLVTAMQMANTKIYPTRPVRVFITLFGVKLPHSIFLIIAVCRRYCDI